MVFGVNCDLLVAPFERCLQYKTVNNGEQFQQITVWHCWQHHRFIESLLGWCTVSNKRCQSCLQVLCESGLLPLPGVSNAVGCGCVCLTVAGYEDVGQASGSGDFCKGGYGTAVAAAASAQSKPASSVTGPGVGECRHMPN